MNDALTEPQRMLQNRQVELEDEKRTLEDAWSSITYLTAGMNAEESAAVIRSLMKALLLMLGNQGLAAEQAALAAAQVYGNIGPAINAATAKLNEVRSAKTALAGAAVTPGLGEAGP